ncbi:MAG: hypothetical protein EA365_09630 [Gloeocapsa sp. DLM2.Bin57]|nr:MAG: hypothetical protein EA365_09630 [Gloeocapsa sp. DLM2.Bin57]
MNKKLLASCLIIGLIFSLIPSTAEARFRRGRRYSRGSVTPTNTTTVYGIEDSNPLPYQGLFRNAISSSYLSFADEVFIEVPYLFPGEAFYGSYFADRVDLLSNYNSDTGVVTYSFQPNAGNVTYVSPDAPNPPDRYTRDNIYNEGVLEYERITNVFLSRSIPESGNPNDYVNNINFILDNDILASPWLNVETESGFYVTLTNPSYMYLGGEMIDEDCLEESGDIDFCTITNGLVIEEVTEEIVPESNLISGLAGILMLGIFKFLANKNNQASKLMSNGLKES